MLALQNVRKTFGPIVAVDGVSLQVRRGECLGLLGPNGAGKTTTISMAVGLLEPDSGAVVFDGGGSPRRPEIRAQIGVAPQSLAIYDELSAYENLCFFAALHGIRGASRNRCIAALLDRVGLSDRARHRVRTYSGGMKRRLNLAVALLHDPPLVLLDEPTVGVDPQSRSAIFSLLKELQAQGRTLIYTTHYMEEAQKLCDRVAIIDHGRVLAMDTVDRLIATHGGASTVQIERLTGIERIETDRPLSTLEGLSRDPAIVGVHVERPSLETVFLHLTGRSLRD